MRAAALLVCLMMAAPAAAAEDPVGRYRAAEGPDVAAEIIFKRDGSFEYGLSAGALDQHAKGRWTMDGKEVRLFTEPKPVPPMFKPATATLEAGEPFSLLVSGPGGRGIAAIDLKIGFATGEPIDSYTQDYGWTLPQDETRAPTWVELSIAMFGVGPTRFPIDVRIANTLGFTLVPNDLGTVDFDGALVDIEGPKLTLHFQGGTIRFVRSK